VTCHDSPGSRPSKLLLANIAQASIPRTTRTHLLYYEPVCAFASPRRSGDMTTTRNNTTTLMTCLMSYRFFMTFKHEWRNIYTLLTHPTWGHYTRCDCIRKDRVPCPSCVHDACTKLIAPRDRRSELKRACNSFRSSPAVSKFSHLPCRFLTTISRLQIPSSVDIDSGYHLTYRQSHLLGYRIDP
jgi:hypothetical protein